MLILIGRIGRIVLRNALESQGIDVVAINECVFLLCALLLFVISFFHSPFIDLEYMVGLF